MEEVHTFQIQLLSYLCTHTRFLDHVEYKRGVRHDKYEITQILHTTTRETYTCIQTHLLGGEYSECVAVLFQGYTHLCKHCLPLQTDALSAFEFLLPSLIKF